LARRPSQVRLTQQHRAVGQVDDTNGPKIPNGSGEPNDLVGPSQDNDLDESVWVDELDGQD